MGKQLKIKKDLRPRSKRSDQRERSLNLTVLPPLLQKWFAYVPGFTPGKGRHIEETMPDIPLSRAKYHIGAGTQFQIGELANL